VIQAWLDLRTMDETNRWFIRLMETKQQNIERNCIHIMYEHWYESINVEADVCLRRVRYGFLLTG